jgi:predicted dehydrogenase
VNNGLRTALIGLGQGAEQFLLPAISRVGGLNLVAACDPEAARRERARQRWGIAQVYESAEQMLQQEAPELAIIAAPPQTHHALAVLALSHNCHLFCEKPFMLTLSEADAALAQAAGRGRQVAVNNQYYQMPIFRRLQREIDSGRAGRVYQIHAWQQMHLPPHEESGWKQALRPRRVLIESGIHAVDLFCRFFRSYPTAVTAQIARPLPDDATDICVMARLDFPDHRSATLSFNRLSRAPMRYFEMRVEGRECSLRASLGGLARFELSATRQRSLPQMRLSLTTGGEVRREEPHRSRTLARQGSSAWSEATHAHLSRFVDAIQQGRTPETPAAHIRAVLAATLACYESAESGGGLMALPAADAAFMGADRAAGL